MRGDSVLEIVIIGVLLCGHCRSYQCRKVTAHGSSLLLFRSWQKGLGLFICFGLIKEYIYIYVMLRVLPEYRK